MEVVASLSQSRTAAAQCGLFTHKSVPVIFEPPCIYICSGDQIEKMRCGGHEARMGERTGKCRVLVGKPERKRPLGRHGSRWEDNIKMNLQEVGCGGMDRFELAQDRNR